jgi:hypothetical protein
MPAQQAHFKVETESRKDRQRDEGQLTKADPSGGKQAE